MDEILTKACGEQSLELNAHIVAGYDDALIATYSYLDFVTLVRNRPNACRDIARYASFRQKQPNLKKVVPKNLTNGLVRVSLCKLSDGSDVSLKGKKVDGEINEEMR